MSAAAPRLDSGFELLFQQLPDSGPAVLATVVNTTGSTYRKPGARMLILPEGRYVGLLSGGCLEGDLAEHAARVLAEGQPRAIEYDLRGPDDALFGIGAGCEGAMRILLEPAGAASAAHAALAHATAVTRGGTATALAVVHDGPELGTHAPDRAPSALVAACDDSRARRTSQPYSFELRGAAARAWIEYVAPPPHLLLCGAGPDAEPVARLAAGLGWRVTVVDHRPAYAVAERFPAASVVCAPAAALGSTVALDGLHAVVVMSHHLASDASYLRALSAAGPAYVGLLGPRARRARLLQDLGERSAGLNGRLRGPVGVDLGASTPESIALAIVAEIHAALAGRPGGVAAPLASG
jgi:xanthine/CO dehydrogenase XdhC/CoxF family maturation factor